MHQYLPLILLGLVALTGVVGLALSGGESSTAYLVAERSCNSVQKDWKNCLTPNGGCPEHYPPYKQWSAVIGNVPTCCCDPIKSQDNFHYGQPLYR